ncbi:MAG: nucleotide exchange factor GrpE [Paludibacteraceae bacterium]|jgi:molecular chaperone GrpE|nr:nucleotide exchange factor GrpE [Paludibacteraceae bacterium]
MAEDNNIEEQKVETAEEQTVEATAETAEAAASETAETTDSEAEETATAEPVDERDAKIAELEAQVAAQKDQYLRLYAEFDNYKKRTLKEKAELIQTAGKNVLEQMLPLIDDVERAMVSVQKADSVDGVKEGIDLIYSKFVKFLDSNNVKEIETVGLPFNTDFHEAVAQVPMGEDKKGVVIDCTQKGYIMGEKVVRFAKVVIGA